MRRHGNEAPGRLTLGAALHKDARLIGRRAFGGLLHYRPEDDIDEADLSAEQARAQTAARVPGPDGDRRRAPGHSGAPGARPQEIVRLSPIRLN